MYCCMQCIYIFVFALLCILGGVHMAFQIKPDKIETENKTIRFPITLIDKIEDVIKNHDVSFSGFVLQACEYALDNLDITSTEKTKKK